MKKINVSIEFDEVKHGATVHYNASNGLAFIWGPESKVKEVLDMVQRPGSLAIDANKTTKAPLIQRGR